MLWILWPVQYYYWGMKCLIFFYDYYLLKYYTSFPSETNIQKEYICKHAIYDVINSTSVSSICKGGTGEKDRAPISHESFLLMANSQTDMDDWVKAIRRVIWAPFGGGEQKHKQSDLFKAAFTAAAWASDAEIGVTGTVRLAKLIIQHKTVIFPAAWPHWCTSLTNRESEHSQLTKVGGPVKPFHR